MANVFPKWVNSIPIKVIVAIILIKTAVVLGVTYYATPSIRGSVTPLRSQSLSVMHSTRVNWRLIAAIATLLQIVRRTQMFRRLKSV